MTQLFVDEMVDRLENAGFVVTVQYPYVIVSLSRRSIDVIEVLEALDYDIESSQCARNLSGGVRVTCD